jgi:hypothetical protein
VIKKIITIYGIRRSGNHAVANWIMSHFKSGCYINDANMPVRTQSNHLPCYSKCKLYNLDQNPEIIIIGIENKLNRNIHKKYLNTIIKSDDSNIEINEICLIRNFSNLLASHLKAWPDKTYHENMPQHWYQYIEFYLLNNEINTIIYDHWLDKNYRNDMANFLKFHNQEFGIDEISSYGGGSSFKETIVNKDNLKNRWKSLIDNERFNKIMNTFPYWKEHIDIFGKDEVYNYFNKQNNWHKLFFSSSI